MLGRRVGFSRVLYIAFVCRPAEMPRGPEAGARARGQRAPVIRSGSAPGVQAPRIVGQGLAPWRRLDLPGSDRPAASRELGVDAAPTHSESQFVNPDCAEHILDADLGCADFRATGTGPAVVLSETEILLPY